MSKFFKASTHGKSAEEKSVSQRLTTTVVKFPVSATGIGQGLIGPCPHNVPGCAMCYVTPLTSDTGRHLSYLLEHIGGDGKCIKCTVGTRNLPVPSGSLRMMDKKPGGTFILPRPEVLDDPNCSLQDHIEILEAADILRSFRQSVPEGGLSSDSDLAHDLGIPSSSNPDGQSPLPSKDPPAENNNPIVDDGSHHADTDPLKESYPLSCFSELQTFCQELEAERKEASPEDSSPPVKEIGLSDLQNLHNSPEIDDDTELDVIHTKSTIGSQLAEVKASLSERIPSALVRKSSKALSQLVLLSIGLCNDTNLVSVVTRCIAFLDAMLDDGIAMNIHDTLVAYVNGIEFPSFLKGKTVQECYALENTASRPESLSPDAMAMWEVLKKGIFTKHLSYVVGTAFAFFTCKIQNIEFSHPLHEAVMKHSTVEKIDGVDFIDHVLKLYNWVSTVGVACIEQRSLKPLTLNSGSLAKCHQSFYEVKQWFTDTKREGNSTMEERQLQYVKIETVYNTLVSLCKTERDKYTTLHASSLVREVGTLYNEVKDFVQKIDAVKVARALHLHGPPKVGKSFITAMIHEQHCMARGVPYRQSNNAQPNLMSEFQDEIDNSTQTITLNETSAVKEQYSKSIEKAYTTALALVDPVPFHPNRSNIEDKAKITAQHISVISTGNTEEPFIHVAKTPGAWTRRYISVYMRVKPEFADRDGRFDSRKTDGSHEYHLFDVYEIIYAENGSKTRKYYKFKDGQSKNLGTRDFMELLRSLAIEHYAQEDRLEEERKKKKQDGCLKCKRLAHFCSCDEEGERISFDDMTKVQASVISRVPEENFCEECSQLGPHGNECKFTGNIVACIRCGKEPPSEPEGGVVESALSIGSSILWESFSPWVNPFVKMKWLWSIDSSTVESLREDILEEISYVPDHLGTKLFSMIPQNWLEREDGSPSFLGKQKERFIRMVAAEKQIFLPIRVLLKRAFTLSCLIFLVSSLFIFLLDYLGFKRYEWEFAQEYRYSVTRWGWIPLYPEYSDHVMNNRETYAQRGIYTLDHLEWQQYYVNLYYFQRLLGKLFYFWHYQEEMVTYILVKKMAQWWHFPLIMSVQYFILSFAYMWTRRALGFQKRYAELQKRANADKDLQKNLYDKIRRSPQEYNSLVPTAIGILGVIISGLTAWNILRQQRPEGGLVSRTGLGRGPEWNDFFGVFKRSTPKGSVDNGVTEDDTITKCRKNMCTIKAQYNGEDRFIQGIWIKTGLLMMPHHFFRKDPYNMEVVEEMKIKIQTGDYGTKCKIYQESLSQMPGKDMVILKVPRSPKVKSIMDLLPVNTGADCHSATILHADGTNEKTNAQYMQKIDCAGFSCGRGVRYRSDLTKTGSCGTPIVRKGVILGFHISGDKNLVGKKLGNAQEILREDVDKYIDRIRNDPDFISQPEHCEVPATRLGYKFIHSEGPHPKTKVFEELAEYHGIKVLGNNPNLVRYRSRVRKSMLSDSFAMISGRRNRWKAPDMKEPWRHHNKALKVVAEGAWEVPPLALKWAFDDYLSDILKRLPSYCQEFPQFCQVLDELEMINGIPESMYMKAINMKTSVGPIGKGSGNKVASDLFVEIDRGPNTEKRYALTPEAKKHFDEMKECFRTGKKYGVWSRTCLKDEVVSEDSEKVRIFYILECLFALIVRQYYLPIIEFISRHPLLCECAVGINCAGPEWEELMKFIQELATDGKVTDWDFSKYDLRRALDVMIASLNVFRKIAEFMGYLNEDLVVMDGIADELRNPTIDWNGTIISCYLWSSGNSLTVYGNSIENSLHQRISFYLNGVKKLGLEGFLKLGSFRENERLGTYGDDGQSGSKPSSRPYCDFFAKKWYFDSIGMKITDAAKSDNPQSVLPAESVDFLKRKSVYHDKLGLRVGALSRESIDKMGHMVSGKGDLEDLAVNSIITMLLESFLHGPEIYQQYRDELSQVARKHFLWTDYLDKDYDALADRWHEKYAEECPRPVECL
jgi:hypothetical protein